MKQYSKGHKPLKERNTRKTLSEFENNVSANSYYVESNSYELNDSLTSKDHKATYLREVGRSNLGGAFRRLAI